jgi:HAD superfamily hydrolase (TIGR01509 family)
MNALQNKAFKAIASDLDGTLLRTEHFQFRAWVEVLKKQGIGFSKKEYANYCGKTGKIIEGQLIEKYRLNPKTPLLDEKESLLSIWFSKNRICTMPYARDYLTLVKNKGIASAVVTGCPRDEMHLKLERTRLTAYFSVFVSRDDIKNSKPFPDAYIFTCQELKSKPAETIAVEDTPPGVQSAKEAGLFTIAIPSIYCRKEDFASADLIIDNFRVLIDYLKNCGS